MGDLVGRRRGGSQRKRKKEIKLSALKKRLHDRTFTQVYKITHVGNI